MSLHDVFVDAYRPYLEGRLAERGWERPAGWDEALEEGQRWLEGQLDELLALPPVRQGRGPLELFQEACAFPTGALVEAGFLPVARDPVAAGALPGDLFDLAPASSRLLGESAWMAHLEWGAAKAAAILKQE